MSVQKETKVVVSVTEMARMVGLSRSRFYQLIGTAFPKPERQQETGRPLYTEDQQEVCLEVRRQNCGIDGKPVLFSVRRIDTVPPRPRKAKTPSIATPHADLLDGLRSLGLASATAADVEAAVKERFPCGSNGLDQGEVLKIMFLHLKRKNLDRRA
jgi:hypothetical protein